MWKVLGVSIIEANIYIELARRQALFICYLINSHNKPMSQNSLVSPFYTRETEAQGD